MNLSLPILKGTEAAYLAIANKDANLIYITTDEGNIYLGDIKLGGTKLEKVVKDVVFDTDTQNLTTSYTDGTEVVTDFVLESVFQDIDFDNETSILTITLTNGASTEVSLANLMDLYVGGETESTSTNVVDGDILVDLKVSKRANNGLEIVEDGAFVALPDFDLVEEGNIVVGKLGGGFMDSNRTFVSLIADDTTDTGIPDVAAIKGILAFGTF